MDVVCKWCKEPWDMYEAHDIAKATSQTYQQVMASFTKIGCAAFSEGMESIVATEKNCVDADAEPDQGIQTIYELLGNDMDGAASLIEDFGAIGMLDV